MNKRHLFTFGIMFFILLAVFFWNVCAGSINLEFSEILKILSGKNSELSTYKIIWNIRLPRIFAAMILGGALCVSGFLLQTFFSNPIAGPYVLGISSGAKLFVAIAMIFFLNYGINLNSWGMVCAAFFGSMLSLILVLIISFKIHNMAVLVVCGIMIGYICSAITDFFITFADDSNIVNLHNWSLGSFSGTNWNDVFVMSIIVGSVCLFTFFLSKPISAYQLGEVYAQNLGVNVKLLRCTLIIFSSLLSACVTAFAGPISFVGIAVPHLVKNLIGTNKPVILLPACFLGGALVVLFCDGISRTIFAPTEFSISTITAIFLAPVVIIMMLKRQDKKEI